MNGELRIADAHQHFWDPRVNYHPWLCDEPPIPFRYGDYRAIRRPYLPADYFADARPHRVVRTVYVETEWDPRDPVGEMRYVEQLRRQTGFPTVAVAQAWLDRDDAAAVLEQQAAFAFVRGIRHKPRANRSPADAAPGGMTDAKWRAGFALLTPNRLRFDLQTPWWHLGEAAQLARDFPATTIIVNHDPRLFSTLDTGIDLRNEHLRETYLEVNKGPGFDTATLSEIDLAGFNPDAPVGTGSFVGLLTLHGVTNTVTGPVDVRQAGAGLRVKASFPVDLSDYRIAKPRYLGIGVTNIVHVEVVFAVSR
jgi:predicted TIM-barrel fold metal-dependent hydrolase